MKFTEWLKNKILTKPRSSYEMATWNNSKPSDPALVKRRMLSKLSPEEKEEHLNKQQKNKKAFDKLKSRKK